ncbi:ATP-binding protein [Leptolyngbya sp. AN02str]|uniref:ATP-binding protein n=1 Tax=Leptolyngbya sp. AN02str TaxID=3423363 RepID=UPI003D317CE1
MKLLESKRLQVRTDLGALNQVLAWFDGFAHTFIPQTVWLQCQLVLAEGFTNAVRHAHKFQPPDTDIEIEVQILETCLEIKIWDRGPNNELGTVLKGLSQEMDQEAEGGRGLKLMKKVADELSYFRDDSQRNCLLIVKNYARP